MGRPDRTSRALTAPLDDLLTIVLRQFKRPLAALGITMTDQDAHSIIRAALTHEPLSDHAQTVRDGLAALVAESEAVLQRWNLTFQQSLETDMDAMPGWETTAEFIDIANEKSNAELRIANAAALVMLMGDRRYAAHLLYLASRRDQDMDTVLAQRVLRFALGVDDEAADWLAQVRARLERE